MSQRVGLRERKKAQTRDALVAAALGLFAERGYDATTIEDIADAADVSPRTFFRYFASKDDVLFSGFPDATTEFLELLDARPTDEPVISSLRHAALELSHRELDDVDATRLILSLVTDTKSLADTYLGLLGSIEAMVVEWAARRLGTSTSDLRPRLLAAAAMAARRAAVDTWLRGDTDADLQELLAEALDRLAVGLEQL